MAPTGERKVLIGQFFWEYPNIRHFDPPLRQYFWDGGAGFVMARVMRLAAVAAPVSVSAASNSTEHEVAITLDGRVVPF